jgi:hypothetical protein
MQPFCSTFKFYGKACFHASLCQSLPMKRLLIYTPGVLSLLLLFPLLLNQLHQWGIFKKERVLEVTWHDPTLSQRFPSVKLFTIPTRDYTTINLTGDSADDVKIEYAKVLVNEMLAKFDTINGVRIHFEDAAKYDTFVKVLNFCNRHHRLGYAPYESDFWIFNRISSEENLTLFLCGFRCHIAEPPAVELTDKLAAAFNYNIETRYWPIV